MAHVGIAPHTINRSELHENGHIESANGAFQRRVTPYLLLRGNGISEGINNLITVLKRRAYGFIDFRYFTLKILDATGALPPLDTVGHPQF